MNTIPPILYAECDPKDRPIVGPTSERIPDVTDQIEAIVRNQSLDYAAKFAQIKTLTNFTDEQIEVLLRGD